MVAAIKPKNIVPIHTFKSEAYQEIFTKTNVVVLEDGEQIKV